MLPCKNHKNYFVRHQINILIEHTKFEDVLSDLEHPAWNNSQKGNTQLIRNKKSDN